MVAAENDVRHEREHGAARHGVEARVRVNGAGKKGMRIGREGDSYSS
jgi:hypothetical protein